MPDESQLPMDIPELRTPFVFRRRPVSIPADLREDEKMKNDSSLKWDEDDDEDSDEEGKEGDGDDEDSDDEDSDDAEEEDEKPRRSGKRGR